MKLSTFQSMDVHLLYGLVNTELRNNCHSLGDLCKTHGIDEAELTATLARANYHYVEGLNQFR